MLLDTLAILFKSQLRKRSSPKLKRKLLKRRQKTRKKKRKRKRRRRRRENQPALPNHHKLSSIVKLRRYRVW